MANDTRSILIVDDEEPNRMLLEVILKHEGYLVRQANNGKQALNEAISSRPDLIIMDVCMPVMDGLEACRKLKAHFAEQFVPVILLTGLKDTEDQVKGLDAGADEYLVKPPVRHELLARVRAMLRIRDLHHQLFESRQKFESANKELLKARRIIEEDLKQIAGIQQSFLPGRFPRHDGISFGHYYGPCEQAGGDYYDLIEISRQHWGLLMADVTGHGTPAAVVMAMTHTLMHAFIRSFHCPSTALKVANEKLNHHLAPTFYVTMFYGVLNLDRMAFRYASAGHEPPMLYKAKTGDIHYLKTTHGYPLKFFDHDDYDEVEVHIEPSDKIIMYTDGLIEHRNPEGKLYTIERLEHQVRQFAHLPAQAFVDAIIKEVTLFNPNTKFHDDVTLFVLQRDA